MGVVMEDVVRRAPDGDVEAEAAWPRVADAVRRRAERRGLSPEDADELLHRVQVAIVRRAPFRSPRAAERYGLVVAFNEMKALIDAAAARRGVVVVSLEELEGVAGDGESEAAMTPASRADSPEDRAVLRVAFAELLAALDPQLTATDLLALLHPLREAPYGTRREQVLWGVRAHRIRERLRAAVSDLLAPAVAPLGWWRRRKRLRLLASAASIGGTVLVSIPALLLATETPAAVTLPDEWSAPALAARTAESAPGPVPQVLAGPTAPPVADETSRGHRGADDNPPATVRAGLWREGTTTKAAAQISVRVGAVQSATGNDLTVNVYCDTPARAAACAAVPVEWLPR